MFLEQLQSDVPIFFHATLQRELPQVSAPASPLSCWTEGVVLIGLYVQADEAHAGRVDGAGPAGRGSQSAPVDLALRHPRRQGLPSGRTSMLGAGPAGHSHEG
jgi:hypothetical protein